MDEKTRKKWITIYQKGPDTIEEDVTTKNTDTNKEEDVEIMMRRV